jgi:DNA primase catalytic core
MYITNLEEVVPLLRTKLRDYLVLKAGIRANARKFKCFVHEDNDPSMYFNPKANDETVKCFSCNWSGDIFATASHIENLPVSGPEWVTKTIPHLSELLEIPVKLGDPSPANKERLQLYKLCQDIVDVSLPDEEQEKILEPLTYAKDRGWYQNQLDILSVDEDELISKLVSLGWDVNQINRSMIVRTKYSNFFGLKRLTFVIRDSMRKPIGFISRDLDDNANTKYINTPESAIYEKGKTLLGIDVALKTAKKEGVYIVEGPGDLANLYRLGILNAVAVCGTALTEHHLLQLKSLGIRKLFLNFDWDNPGYIATQRVLENILKTTSGMSVYIVLPPSESFEDYNEYHKDPGEYLESVSKDPDKYLELTKISAFEWQLTQSSENDSPDTICNRMIPVIASEEAAVKRELLIKTLSEFTGISHQAIATDVNSLRSDKFTERKEKLLASANQYVQEVIENPDNIMAHISQHELAVERIETEFKRNTVGVNYQLARYEAILEERSQRGNGDENASSFIMNHFSSFPAQMNGGLSWSRSCLILVGGRPNSGKTAVVLGIGVDVAISDPNTLVIIHSIDDSYEQIEPRLKTNLAKMCFPEFPKSEPAPLQIGMVVQPQVYLPVNLNKIYEQTNDIYKELLDSEKLVIIDSEDGTTMTALERNVRYYRQRYPNKKILLISDNTHNYTDFPNLDKTTRMTLISNAQKAIVAKYHACMIATAEYRKNMPMDTTKLKLPVDDDLADARALMYRPNVIFHVYNDLHDRKDHAEIFWKDQEDVIQPRLLLHFTKNKISGYKQKLVLDLEPASVSLTPKSESSALEEAERFKDMKESGSVKKEGNSLVHTKTTDYKEQEYE